MKEKHKNNNEAKGNFNIYGIFLFKKLFKVGKADANRITQESGLPTRIHQQMRKLIQLFGRNNVFLFIFKYLIGVTTEEAKKTEGIILDDYFENNKNIPEGNKKSYKPKKK